MNKPIRVLHSVPGFGLGGIESLIMTLYKKIDKSKVQFDLLVETQEWLPDFDEIIKNGGRVYQISPFNKKKPWKFISQIKAFFKKHRGEFSVLHSHTITRSAPVLYYSKKHGVQCRISHAHTDCLDGNRFIALSEWLMRLNNRLSTHFMAASKQAGHYFFNKDSKDFIVLKNSIDTSSFLYSTKLRKSTRLNLKLNNQFVIGHTGRFTYQKNHWKIIEVFNQVLKLVPNSKLLLAGDGTTMDEINEKVNSLGIKEHVIFLGSRSDVSELLQAMDVFLLPSFFEGFCISLLEAQSVGLPCVASDVIPQEVQMTNLIKTLALEEGNIAWSNAIVAFNNHKRISMHQKIIDQGYDTRENAKWLSKYYINNSFV